MTYQNTPYFIIPLDTTSYHAASHTKTVKKYIKITRLHTCTNWIVKTTTKAFITPLANVFSLAWTASIGNVADKASSSILRTVTCYRDKHSELMSFSTDCLLIAFRSSAKNNLSDIRNVKLSEAERNNISPLQ